MAHVVCCLDNNISYTCRSINNSRLCYKACDEFGLDDMSDEDENGEVDAGNSPYTPKEHTPYWYGHLGIGNMVWACGCW